VQSKVVPVVNTISFSLDADVFLGLVCEVVTKTWQPQHRSARIPFITTKKDVSDETVKVLEEEDIGNHAVLPEL
jgi:hypothetical protein